SELIRRITSDDIDERMPPADSNLRLSDSERDVLRRWIDQGARYSVHWSFAPVARPPLPSVRDASWPRGPLDRFVLHRLERQGLTPSPPADPATLMRRVCLDLTGLPPTPEESSAFVDEFEHDAEGAYQRLVDR